MAKFPNIPNKHITYFGYRAEPYFASAVIAGGFSNRKNLKEKFQLKNPLNVILAGYELFNVQPTVDAFTRELKSKLEAESSGYINKIVKECFRSGNRLLAISKRIGLQARKSNLTKLQLAILLTEYKEVAYDYCIYYTIAWFEKTERELAEIVAKKYSSNEKQRQELLWLITSPSRETAAEMEQDDFLKICSQKNITPAKSRKLAAAHAKKYGWLAVRFFIGRPWNYQDILERLAHSNASTSAKMLRTRIIHRKKTKQRLGIFAKRMSREDRNIIRQIRNIIFLRTQRADFFNHSSFFIQPLAYRIADILNIPYSDMLNFSPDELIAALKENFSVKKHVSARRECMITFHTGTNACLEGQQAKKYIATHPVLQKSIVITSECKGTCAFPGKVRGRAKVVLSNEDISKVKKGDILIATMTTPNFIAAMERAAAFVTNEGGILCHAAIVSREMKKPCVIGTLIATKIFNDGDMVEVDANKGIVRKL